METPIIVALVGISGIILGASLQFFFGKRIETTKQFKSLQTQAYVDFLRGVAGVAKAQEFKNKDKELEYIILVSDSKQRISVYGNLEVAKKIAEFFRDYSETASEGGAKFYAKIVKAMREDSIGVSESLSETEIEQILFSNPRIKGDH